jgi:hypothetical protein
MSFIGVAVFINITPASLTAVQSPVLQGADLLTRRQEEGFPWQQLLNAIRSFAMLFFIEAIAWFLLRQHRSLIEDYKLSYRQYMRRANYLAAVKLSAQKGEKDLFNKIIETYLQEDLTGRMKKDKTTEWLEGQRLIDSNFVENLVTRLFDVAQSAIAKSK